ncbi:MAG: DUF4962 domain-containing protein [Armatimonadota bacterium]
MRHLILSSTLLCLLLAASATAAPLVSLDFEQGTDLKSYPSLSLKDLTSEIVAGGADGAGHCLKIANTSPSKYCQASVRGPFAMQKNLVLSFDHKEQIEGGKPNYMGIIFNGEKNTQWFASDTFSDQWRHVEIIVGDMQSPTDTIMTATTVFPSVNLYGRASNEEPGKMTVWLDNIRLEVAEPKPVLTDRQRISYSNPPFFNWPGAPGKYVLQYSPDQTFPAAQTTSVELSRNFYLPQKPLAVGTLYWRVKRQTELSDAWMNIERIVILPESHRFTTPPIPADLATRAHPRLIVAPVVSSESEKAGLISQARSLAKQGIPDDPPAYAPGNPEWPTWIDWYGKVHGGITSRAGTRLQQMAELYVRTKSPEVRDLLKPLAFKAATWNPDGGSSMRNGDIGAQHLLRGLNWCYDALYNDLNETERETLRKVIVARGAQFWKSLNPFKIGGREYNNHSWLCTLALGESGLLLTGEYPEAADWAEYARELYLGLYLPGLGWQGDNNEGISYWGYGLQFVIKYADLMRDVCGIDLFQHPWLYQTGRFPLYTTIPGAWAVSFADTGKPNHSVFGPAQTTQVADLAVRTKDPYALWYSGKYAGADFDPKPPVDLPQSIHYRFIGWSVFNTSLVEGGENVTFALRSGPFWAGHQHEDQNSFVINAYGEKLAIDSGYYDWFGSPHFKEYSVLTKAHNAILVNGLGQDSRKPGADGEITAWFDSPGYGYTVGDASNPAMYQGNLKRWDRRALFIKPGLVIVHDVLGSAKGPAQYDWLLHTVAPIEISGTGVSAVASPVGLPAFSFTSGKASLSGTFLAPKDLALQVKAGYPVEPVDGYSTRPVPPEKYSHEWTLTATPKEKRQNEDIFAVMQIQRGEAPKAKVESIASNGAFGVKITDGAETTLVLSRKREAQSVMSGGGLESDGEVASVTLDADGRVLRSLLVGGKSLQYNGKPLIGSSEPVNASLTRNAAGLIISTTVSKPCTVRFPQERPRSGPVAIGPSVNGKAQISSMAQNGIVLLMNEPGDSQLLFDGALPLKIEQVKAGGLDFQSAGSVVGNDYRRTFWTTLNLPEGGRYRLTLPNPVPGISVSLDNKRLPLEKSGTEAAAWLNPGRHLLLISGVLQLPELSWQSDKLNFAAVTMLPVEFRPRAQAIVIEAEKSAAEGEVKSQSMDKVGASGGKASCVWDTPGQWAEWTVKVPREGDYRLLIRGCSEQAKVLRSVEIDQGKPGAISAGIELPGTGGWARISDDWRYFVVNKDGQLLRLHLTAGEHRLRLEAVGGSMNVDLFALEPLP